MSTGSHYLVAWYFCCHLPISFKFCCLWLSWNDAVTYGVFAWWIQLEAQQKRGFMIYIYISCWIRKVSGSEHFFPRISFSSFLPFFLFPFSPSSLPPVFSSFTTELIPIPVWGHVQIYLILGNGLCHWQWRHRAHITNLLSSAGVFCTLGPVCVCVIRAWEGELWPPWSQMCWNSQDGALGPGLAGVGRLWGEAGTWTEEQRVTTLL